MNIDSTLFAALLDAVGAGLFSGFTIGFISWGVGFAIYGIIKFFKMA